MHKFERTKDEFLQSITNVGRAFENLDIAWKEGEHRNALSEQYKIFSETFWNNYKDFRNLVTELFEELDAHIVGGE